VELLVGLRSSRDNLSRYLSIRWRFQREGFRDVVELET
jgi:hypothetical protein